MSHLQPAEGSPQAVLADLRQQMLALADSVAEQLPRVAPDRIERENPQKLGPLWEVPGPLSGHVVRVIGDAGGDPECVFVEGGQFSWGGDMEAFLPDRARALAMALLAAADWAQGRRDELGLRRGRSPR